MTQAILTLNAGSSSIKFALFAADADSPVPLARGKIEGIGTAPHMVARDANGSVLTERTWDTRAAMNHEAFLDGLFTWIDAHLDGAALIGIGHRVVHGGTQFSGPERVTPSVMESLNALCPLAPLHQPHNLAAIQAVTATRPQTMQVACFDTAFHQSLPPVARRFALPRDLEVEGIKRYGFHGLSYEYIARQLAQIDPTLAQGRVIVAHLGNGASLCAMRAGRSIDTSMGFTALDGLMMGTRCGTLDAGVILYLLEQKGMSAADVGRLLYNQSGLLGVSELSNDMKILLASDDPRAAEAVDLFTYRIAREAGALTASLGGLDGLIFTAGIGENAAPVRRDVCQRMAWLGIALDEGANLKRAPVISASGSKVAVHVIPTDEERMIAMHTCGVLMGTRT